MFGILSEVGIVGKSRLEKAKAGPTRLRFGLTRVPARPRPARHPPPPPVTLRHVTPRLSGPRCPRQPPSRTVAQPVAGALGLLGPRRGRRASEEGRRKGGLASDVRRCCCCLAWPRQSCVAIPRGLSRSIRGRHGTQNTPQAPRTHQHCIDSATAPQRANCFLGSCFVFVFTALGSAGHPPAGVDVTM